MGNLISIIVPVYNVESYLSDCIQSIVSQTWQEIEIILVDDGSTDRSGALCDEWTRKDPRIRVIHKENGGVASARNEGLKIVRGEFVGFVDSDDWIDPEMYACLIGAADGADMICCGYVDYPVGMDQPVLKGEKEVRTDSFEEAIEQIYIRNGYFRSVCNKLFRHDRICPSGRPILMNESIAVGEDELWLCSVMRECRFFAFVPKHYYHYRPRSGSATRVSRMTNEKMTVLKAKQRVIDQLKGYDAAVRLARSVMYNDCFLLLVQCYCEGDQQRLSQVSDALKPMRRDWLAAKDIPLLRKLKVMMMEFAMTIGMPGKAVEAISDTRGKALRSIIK